MYRACDNRINAYPASKFVIPVYRCSSNLEELRQPEKGWGVDHDKWRCRIDQRITVKYGEGWGFHFSNGDGFSWRGFVITKFGTTRSVGGPAPGLNADYAFCFSSWLIHQAPKLWFLVIVSKEVRNANVTSLGPGESLVLSPHEFSHVYGSNGQVLMCGELLEISIDVPNSHWLVDENEGFNKRL